MKYPCPCCGFYTIEKPPEGDYDICPVCFWENDPVQVANEDFPGGANHVSLRQARLNYIQFGACEEGMKKYVRVPRDEERKGPS